MAPLKHCPYDPTTLFDTSTFNFSCPVCGCTVRSGYSHEPCVDPRCRFHVAPVRITHPSRMPARVVTPLYAPAW
jgi:hypothetical protein